jgi:hypothetical protein
VTASFAFFERVSRALPLGIADGGFEYADEVVSLVSTSTIDSFSSLSGKEKFQNECFHFSTFI